MLSNKICPGLINSSYEHGDAIRIAVTNRCNLVRVNYLNLIIKTLKRPFVMTYCDVFGVKDNEQWNGIIGELVNNRSDFSGNMAANNYDIKQLTTAQPSHTAMEAPY